MLISNMMPAKTADVHAICYNVQVEAAVGEQPYAHMPLDALAVRKVQCAAPILSVLAVKGQNFLRCGSLAVSPSFLRWPCCDTRGCDAADLGHVC